MNETQALRCDKLPPLFHTVHSDDEYLLNTIDGAWFDILYHFPWENYCYHAANYYEALYQFNIEQALSAKKNVDKNPETKQDAQQRLLFERPTMKNSDTDSSHILYQNNIVDFGRPKIDPTELAPGVVPARCFGRKPKCFFSLLKSFIGTTLMGYPSEPEQVYSFLNNNPSFARVCGFTLHDKRTRSDYQQIQVPSLRKLEQFDQIMREAGIWDQIKVCEVQQNLKSGVFELEKELVGDTTHYHAYSGYETVKYEDDKDKVQKKSQSKVTKSCRCEDREQCSHEWKLCDEGAGTIVKSSTKMYWGHKASIIGLPRQGVVLDAVAVMDAATHDGKTFYPHVRKVFEQYPEVASSVNRVLYDSACSDTALKNLFHQELGVELKASFNPRAKKAIITNLPRGIDRITPYGVPICHAGHKMEYKGIRYDNEKFIFSAPIQENGASVCTGCSKRHECCNLSEDKNSSRTITVSFDVLPHIDPSDPPMAKRFKAIMARRPSVERMIKRLKCDLSDPHLSKRGNESFQAYLDKTVIGYHILLRQIH